MLWNTARACVGSEKQEPIGRRWEKKKLENLVVTKIPLVQEINLYSGALGVSAFPCVSGKMENVAN